MIVHIMDCGHICMYFVLHPITSCQAVMEIGVWGRDGLCCRCANSPSHCEQHPRKGA